VSFCAASKGRGRTTDFSHSFLPSQDCAPRTACSRFKCSLAILLPPKVDRLCENKFADFNVFIQVQLFLARRMNALILGSNSSDGMATPRNHETCYRLICDSLGDVGSIVCAVVLRFFQRCTEFNPNGRPLFSESFNAQQQTRLTHSFKVRAPSLFCSLLQPLSLPLRLTKRGEVLLVEIEGII
jgi:hypothetical protein